jgi:hypothetical protein
MLLVACTAARAQWTNQTISLHAGWNAIFLEGQPEPSDCDTLFAGLPIESVWGWNRQFSTVQYIQDPTELVPGQSDWLVWLPRSSPHGIVVSLSLLQAEHAYLIKMPDTASPVTLQISIRPVVRNADWLSSSFNFVGFHVDSASPPTFQSWFAASPAHAGRPIYRLTSAGTWSQINAVTDRPNRGEAYWINTLGQSTYAGPLTITLEQGHGLDYGRSLTEQTLRIRNTSTASRTVTLKALSSTQPPVGFEIARAGDVPLSYWKMTFPNNVGFFPFPSQLNDTLAPGAEWAIRLAVRRADMAGFTPPAGAADALYESLLQLTDGAGTRWLVPVTAHGLQDYPGGSQFRPAGLPPNPRAGLWVGSAVIRKISQPSNLDDANLPRSTASEFQFRLVVHVDRNGQAQLLQKVLLMWKNGTYTNNTDGIQVLDQPGRYVLLTDERLAPNFTGAALRDGEPVARRYSSAAFSFRSPILMTANGVFGGANSTFTCPVLLDYDDPLNPFKHKYHPDHDNFTERFDQKLPEGVESFTVNRQVQLQFSATDPDNTTLAGWGDNQLGGTYRETITGLHKNTLNIEGTFRLQRASRVAVLNDAM